MIPDGMIPDNSETMTGIMTVTVLNLSGGKPVLPHGGDGIESCLQEEERHAGCE